MMMRRFALFKPDLSCPQLPKRAQGAEALGHRSLGQAPRQHVGSSLKVGSAFRGSLKGWIYRVSIGVSIRVLQGFYMGSSLN